MDFVVSETEVVVSIENEILAILSRLFLAASNAFINCKDGKIKLTFENMTIELNVFNL